MIKGLQYFLKANIFVLFIYFVSSVIFTYPLILNLGTLLPGQPNDAFVYLWNIYNFWNQISNQSSVFYTQNVMYPIGANFFFHTYAPLISIIALPFLNNLSLFMGLAVIVAVLMSSFTCFLLIKYITKNNIAAFVGGLIYGISPIVHSFIISQHYYFLFSAPFYPLGIMLLTKYFTERKNKYLFFSMSLFWPVLAIDYYSAVLYALLISIFFIINLKINIHNLLITFYSILLIIVTPFILIYFSNPYFKEFVNFKQNLNTSSSCNTNLAGFITPSIDNPIIGMGDNNINLDTPSYFLGWGIFLLFIISSIKNHKIKYVKSILFIFVTFLLLSLGTKINFGEKTILEGIYTPFYYFLKIPILGSIDCPIRFPIILQLCLSILISFFIAKSKNIKRASAAILLIMLIEYISINKDFSSTEVPDVYYQIKNQQNQRTLLEIPSGITESKGAFGYDWSIQALHSKQMYWQSIHHKPRFGVYMSRLTPDKYSFYRTESILSEIFNFMSAGGEKPKNNFNKTDIEGFIKKYNLGYIVLSPNARQKDFEEFIDDQFKSFIIEKKVIEGYIYYILSDIHS